MELAASRGFSIQQILKPEVKTPKKNGKTYINPNNDKQTWTGHGKRPGWVVEFLNNGGDLKSIESSAV